MPTAERAAPAFFLASEKQPVFLKCAIKVAHVPSQPQICFPPGGGCEAPVMENESQLTNTVRCVWIFFEVAAVASAELSAEVYLELPCLMTQQLERPPRPAVLLIIRQLKLVTFVTSKKKTPNLNF